MRFRSLILFVTALSLMATGARANLETVATFDADTPPGNIAVGPDGRIFMSLHFFYGPETRVVEVMSDGSTTPYPPNGWATAPNETGVGLNAVLGVRVDRRGILWMLDGAGENFAGRLVGWDTKTETLHRIIYLASPIIPANAFLNDIAINRDHEKVYIADTAGGDNSAIIVVDLVTGQARRVLEGTQFTVPEDIDMVIDGRNIELGGNPARIGVNPITVDPTNTWVYFGPMSGTSIYRVRTSDLNDASLSAPDLEARVERYGERPISDGATIDGGGNVYITDITNDAVGAVRPDGSYEVLFQRDDLSWPDGFAYGPDDKIYVVINELHRSPPLAGGENRTQGEFKLMRFDPLVNGAQGR